MITTTKTTSPEDGLIGEKKKKGQENISSSGTIRRLNTREILKLPDRV